MTELFAVLSCADFPDAPGCCDSCHEDQDMGYGMIELDEAYGDPVTAVVCCRVWQHIEPEWQP